MQMSLLDTSVCICSAVFNKRGLLLDSKSETAMTMMTMIVDEEKSLDYALMQAGPSPLA